MTFILFCSAHPTHCFLVIPELDGVASSRNRLEGITVVHRAVLRNGRDERRIEVRVMSDVAIVIAPRIEAAVVRETSESRGNGTSNLAPLSS